MSDALVPLNVLFLSKENCARSILAEAVLSFIGKKRFRAFSAGTNLGGQTHIHPQTLTVLERAGIPSDGLRCKPWEEFAAPDAPKMDLIITVCDVTASIVWPEWAVPAAKAHWGFADPMAGELSDATKLEALRQTLHGIKRRLEIFVSLPEEKLARAVLGSAATALHTQHPPATVSEPVAFP